MRTCVYSLADARAFTLPPQHSPPVRTKISSKMATQRDVENKEMLPNACVLLDSHSDPSDGDPLLQPRSLGIAKRRTRVRRSLLLHSDLREEPSSNSTRIAESHGRRSLGQSKQRVEVTGSCLLLNPNSLITRYFPILCLVLRAVNVPSIRKYFIKKKKHF